MSDNIINLDKKVLIWALSIVIIIAVALYSFSKIDLRRNYNQYVQINNIILSSERTANISTTLPKMSLADTNEIKNISNHLWLLYRDNELIHNVMLIWDVDTTYIEFSAFNNGSYKNSISLKPMLPERLEQAIGIYKLNGTEAQSELIFQSLDQKGKTEVLTMIGDNIYLKCISYRS